MSLNNSMVRCLFFFMFFFLCVTIAFIFVCFCAQFCYVFWINRAYILKTSGRVLMSIDTTDPQSKGMETINFGGQEVKGQGHARPKSWGKQHSWPLWSSSCTSLVNFLFSIERCWLPVIVSYRIVLLLLLLLLLSRCNMCHKVIINQSINQSIRKGLEWPK